MTAMVATPYMYRIALEITLPVVVMSIDDLLPFAFCFLFSTCFLFLSLMSLDVGRLWWRRYGEGMVVCVDRKPPIFNISTR